MLHQSTTIQKSSETERADLTVTGAGKRPACKKRDCQVIFSSYTSCSAALLCCRHLYYTLRLQV